MDNNTDHLLLVNATRTKPIRPTPLVLPRPEFDLTSLEVDPRLEALRRLEAARLKEEFSGDPWHAKRAAEMEKAGIDYWRRLAGSYATGSI